MSLTNFISLLGTAGSGSAGFMFAHTNNPSDTSGTNYDYPSADSLQSLAYKSNGNLVATWVNFQPNTYPSRAKIVELDVSGAVLNSRMFDGDVRNNTSSNFTDNGKAICVDENDNVYAALGAGNNGGTWIIKLSADLQTVVWENNQYATASAINGMGATSSYLWTCGVDGGVGIFTWDLSTGTELSTYRHSFISEGMEDRFENCHAAFVGGGRVGFGLRTNNKDPYLVLTTPGSTSVTGAPVNDYQGATSNPDYPSGVGSAWKVGDAIFANNNVFVTGRQNRSGSRVYYVTEMTLSGTQVNNGYFSLGYVSITPPSVDRDGNCYFLVRKYYAVDDVTKDIVVKLDSSFTVSQAISFTPVQGGNFGWSSNVRYATAINQDDTRIGFILQATTSNGNRAFTAVSISTDLTSVATGIYDYPIQAGLYAGAQFEIEDVTSEIASDFVTEVSTATHTTSITKTHVNHSTYGNSVSAINMTGTSSTTSI